MNRADRVYEYMKRYGSITPLDALRDLGYMRLAAAIFELKRNGCAVHTKTEFYKTVDGRTVHYARYSLGDENEV